MTSDGRYILEDVPLASQLRMVGGDGWKCVTQCDGGCPDNATCVTYADCPAGDYACDDGRPNEICERVESFWKPTCDYEEHWDCKPERMIVNCGSLSFCTYTAGDNGDCGGYIRQCY